MKYLVGNWKMNPSSEKGASELAESIKRGISGLKNVETIICPPFVWMSSLRGKIKLGSQDCFWEQQGAYTGEVSPAMLKNIGCGYVILGHSERRQYLGETDEMVGKKLKAVIQAGLITILCIGETKEEREEGKTEQALKKQISALYAIRNTKYEIRIFIAYEPVWAISTGNSCLPDTAKEALTFIKDIRTDAPVLYGGSVSAHNARQYIDAGFDGLLIGNASLDALEFIKTAKILDELSM